MTKRRYPSDRSERARQLVAEGRFGGADYGRLGGRPRRAPASAELADAAVNHVDEIIQALRDAMDERQPMRTRLDAVRLWLEIERNTIADEPLLT